MENKIYSWLVNKGYIIIQKNKDCVSLELDYNNEEHCLLTNKDTYEIIEILTSIAKQIWENPNYKKKPYTKQLYKTSGNKYYWDLENSKLVIQHNNIKNGIEINYIGNSKLIIELNQIVEIIQILEQLNK